MAVRPKAIRLRSGVLALLWNWRAQMDEGLPLDGRAYCRGCCRVEHGWLIARHVAVQAGSSKLQLFEVAIGKHCFVTCSRFVPWLWLPAALSSVTKYCCHGELQAMIGVGRWWRCAAIEHSCYSCSSPVLQLRCTRNQRPPRNSLSRHEIVLPITSIRTCFLALLFAGCLPT
jgi:hypothetical protein